MAIIPLRAWYIDRYEPLTELVKRPHSLRLNRSSLLKSALRADFLDESKTIEQSPWFNYYLEGEKMEFYIEGSGYYAIANIDLISQEIYFTKQESQVTLEPTIYFSAQTQYPEGNRMVEAAIAKTLKQLNPKSRLKLKVVRSPRLPGQPLRLSKLQFRQIRKSLLFIADTTAIAQLPEQNLSLPSPEVSVEIGYALDHKPLEHILLIHQQRPEFPGTFPFDISQHHQLTFKEESDLGETLPTMVMTLLHRFNLFSHTLTEE
ncbi:MAG: hypothetical protein HC796_08795 [Synechococcaceae cyanobacterium RL_1_2]|nr:hypothetical protein [Synechococcaceae cyanobacterium RL_1_2]